MTHRGDQRYRAGRDRANEPFVAERQQVLEATAAAREHDHVDLRRRAELVESVGHRLCRERSLHVGLGDENPSGGETPGDGRQHIPLRSGVVPRDETDATRETW